MTNLVRSTYLEIPARERGGIERKGNFIIDLRFYKLFQCSVGPMIRIDQRARKGEGLALFPYFLKCGRYLEDLYLFHVLQKKSYFAHFEVCNLLILRIQ